MCSLFLVELNSTVWSKPLASENYTHTVSLIICADTVGPGNSETG